MIKYKEYQHVIIERGVSETQDTLHRKVLSAQAVAALGIFLRVFLKKHKLHNLIEREIHILTTTTIKKTRKYIKFIIAFYEFLYFEIVA